jgi:RNA polymerase sigma-70 factor (ECF subfamily)
MEFKDIYIQYSPKVYRVCMGYLNDADLAKDLTQETFIAVWRNLSSFRQESSLSTWIFRIATNNCLRALEKSRRAALADIPLDLAEDQDNIEIEKLGFLYQCIGELEETDRIIISLALEDLSHVEIASVVGLSHANIRVRIHRIKEKLATKFKTSWKS